MDEDILKQMNWKERKKRTTMKRSSNIGICALYGDIAVPLSQSIINAAQRIRKNRQGDLSLHENVAVWLTS